LNNDSIKSIKDLSLIIDDVNDLNGAVKDDNLNSANNIFNMINDDSVISPKSNNVYKSFELNLDDNSDVDKINIKDENHVDSPNFSVSDIDCNDDIKIWLINNLND